MYNQTVVNFARKSFDYLWQTNGNNFMRRLYLRLRKFEWSDFLNPFHHNSNEADELAEEIREMIKDSRDDYKEDKSKLPIRLFVKGNIDQYTITLRFPDKGDVVIDYKSSARQMGGGAKGIAIVSITGCKDKSLSEFCEKIAKNNFFKQSQFTITAAADNIRSAINKLNGWDIIALHQPDEVNKSKAVASYEDD